jgi:hypothetical protein
VPKLLLLFLLTAAMSGSIIYHRDNRVLALAQEDTCARPKPIPIVKKNVFAHSNFVLKKFDNIGKYIYTGIETVKLNHGDILTITNSGCEFITLKFRFETNRLTGKVNNPKYLYARSVYFMKQIVNGLNSPLNLQTGIVALKNYGTRNCQPKLDTEIEYGGKELRSVVSLGEIATAANGRKIVEITFYYGPL